MTTFELFFFWYCFFFWQSNHDFLLSSGFLSRATSEIFSQVARCCGEEGELASFAAWNVISSTLWDHSEQLHFTFIFYLDQFSIIHKYYANVIMKKRTQLQKKLSAIIHCGISIGLVKWNYFDLIEQILHDVCEKKVVQALRNNESWAIFYFQSMSDGFRYFQFRCALTRGGDSSYYYECRIHIESIVHLIFLIFSFLVHLMILANWS